MNTKVTYHQQVSYCGKPRCKRCREGIGHGPYWYAYQTVEGRTTRTYIGKHLPPEAEATMLGNQQSSPMQANEKDQAVIRIYTLGQFRLERRDPRDPLDWQTVTDASWQHQRVRALLGCLVSVVGRKLGREQITEALWPDLDMETAGSRLDRAVYSLRQVFEPGRNRPATSPLLLTEREVLTLADSSQIWVDADVFEQLLTQAHEMKAEEDIGTKEKLLKEAANLFGGEFLPEDQRNEWTRARRESLQRSWIGLLLELADLMIGRDALVNAIEPLDKLISVDPTNEAGVQRLMIVLEKLGRRGEALRAYKKLASVLQREYNIAPLPDTRKLYDDLMRGRHKARAGESVAEQAARDASSNSGAMTESPAVQIGRSHQSPLVGRQQELEQLRELLTSTEQAARFRLGAQRRSTVATLDPNRRPQCVLLMGDVGIGKTRLAEELGREAKKRGWAVAWSRVYAQEGTIPYRLWTEVLRKAMDQGVWQRQEVKRRPLVFQPLGTLLPEIHDLLATVNFPSSLSPEQEQLRLWEAARELLTLISESTPLLITLDDLQWADSSSCELLAYLARRSYGYPITIIGTCRENELDQNSPLRSLLTDLRRENAVETISLDLLSEEQINSLVSQVSHAPETMIEEITKRAGGNPFFAEELARSVTDAPAPHLATDRSGSANDNLPDTINAVLALRLTRLSERCQQLLGKAAVIGGSFEFQAISEMESQLPNHEDVVLDLLEEALRSGMLTEEGTGTRITYHFWHPLLKTYLYDRLSAARRASLHRKAAEVFRTMYQGHEEEGAAKIAHHLINGGADNLTIAKYAEVAGNYAFSLSSYSEAEDNYRVALKYLNNDNNDWQHFSYILERLGACTRIQGKFEEARGFYEAALKEIAKDQQDFLTGSKQKSLIQALLWHEIGRTWYNSGNSVNAKQCYAKGEEVLSILKVEDGTVWANIRLQQSYVNFREGSYSTARLNAQRALQLFEKAIEAQKNNLNLDKNLDLSAIEQILVREPVELGLGRTYSLLSNIEAADGQYTNGLPLLQQALEIFSKYGSVREIAMVSCNLGDRYLRMADYAKAQSVLRSSLNGAERIGDIPLVSFSMGNLGVLDLRIGNLFEAEKEIRQTIEQVKRSDDPISVSIWCTYLSMVLIEQGNLDEASSVLGQALTLSHKVHISPCIGLALVAAANFRMAQAKEIFEENAPLLADKKKLMMLRRAQSTLRHALDLDGIEAETRAEGQLGLAFVTLILGDIDNAICYAEKASKDVNELQITWLEARVKLVFGVIYDRLKDFEQADQYFEQSMYIFRKNGMMLENARSSYWYSKSLLKRKELNWNYYEQGLKMLEEVCLIFENRGAKLDLQLAKRDIQFYKGNVGLV